MAGRKGERPGIPSVRVRMRAARLEAGVTVPEMARRLGVTASTVSASEVKRHPPSRAVVQAYAFALGVPVAQLDPSRGETTGDLVYAARRAARMSRERLAGRSGVSVAYLGRVEAGLKRPSPAALRRIAAALKLPPSALGRSSLEGRSATSAEPGSVGDLIRQARHRAHLSLGDVASKAGVSKSALSYAERGLKRPLGSTLERLARVLGEPALVTAARSRDG